MTARDSVLDLKKYREPLWIVFPFLNADKDFSSTRLNDAQEVLKGFEREEETLKIPASAYSGVGCFPLPAKIYSFIQPEIELKHSYDDSELFPQQLKNPGGRGPGMKSLVVGRQTLYRFFLPDYDNEEMIQRHHLEALEGREQLMVDQWWILMPDESGFPCAFTKMPALTGGEDCLTTVCTADDQRDLHFSLRVWHPLLLVLDIIRQYTKDSINDSFDFDRVMEYYDGLILDIVGIPPCVLKVRANLPPSHRALCSTSSFRACR